MLCSLVQMEYMSVNLLDIDIFRYSNINTNRHHYKKLSGCTINKMVKKTSTCSLG